MRYKGEEALGLVETIGLVPALKACDEMLKAANVELISYENIGSNHDQRGCGGSRGLGGSWC